MNNNSSRKQDDQEQSKIRPFVETVEDEAFEQLCRVNPKRIVIDFNDPKLKKDPDYCKLKEEGPRTDVPEAVRGFVASVIQAALHKIYEEGLRHQDSSDEASGEIKEEARSLVELSIQQAFERMYGDNSGEEEESEDKGQDEDVELKGERPGKEPIVLDDEEHITPNIAWPRIGEFTPDMGLKKVEEYIKEWDLDENWMHCTNLTSVEDQPYDVVYRYHVRWSIPTRRSPIPKATISTFFTIQVSKIRPKNQPVDVYYVIETFQTRQRPGKVRFCEQWLQDALDNKNRLMRYINY